MAFLLDTHTLIWYFEADPQLPPTVAEILEDTSHDLCISMAILWEMAIKLGLGKLTLKLDFHELNALLNQFSITVLPIAFEDITCYLDLPLHPMRSVRSSLGCPSN